MFQFELLAVFGDDPRLHARLEEAREGIHDAGIAAGRARNGQGELA